MGFILGSRPCTISTTGAGASSLYPGGEERGDVLPNMVLLLWKCAIFGNDLCSIPPRICYGVNEIKGGMGITHKTGNWKH